MNKDIEQKLQIHSPAHLVSAFKHDISGLEPEVETKIISKMNKITLVMKALNKISQIMFSHQTIRWALNILTPILANYICK